MVKEYEDDQLKIKLDERKILYVSFKKETSLTLETAKKFISGRAKITEGKNYPVLSDLRNIKNSEEDAIKFLDSIATDNTTTAIITNNKFERLIGNFIVAISKPRLPIRLFKNEERALLWLNNYKKAA